MRDTTTSVALKAGYGVSDPSQTQLAMAAINQGTVPSARLIMSSQPTNADTIGIGGKTFTFVTSLGAAGATVQVKIGASAAATLASLVKAINGTVAAAEWVEATTPFAVAVLADAVSTSLRIRLATARGGSALAGVAPSVALAEAITAAADIWTNANLNESGKSPADCNEACGTVAITAQMVTALTAGASVFIELPFTLSATSVYGFDVLTSTGAKKASAAIPSDTLTISGNALALTSAGSVHVGAGDLLSYWVCQ